MPRRPVVVAALLCAMAAGCRVGGAEVVPLAGPAPDVVAVWPFALTQQDTQEGATVRSWFPGLAGALRQRGYRVVADGVARQLLADAQHAPTIADLNATGRTLHADALLQLLVRDFESSGGRAMQAARWDLEWRLVSTRGGGVLWSFAHHGSWRQSDAAPFDPFRSLDVQEDPGPLVPIGGDRTPGFRDAADLLAWLHRLACEHLPRREEA